VCSKIRGVREAVRTGNRTHGIQVKAGNRIRGARPTVRAKRALGTLLKEEADNKTIGPLAGRVITTSMLNRVAEVGANSAVFVLDSFETTHLT